jgi:hypothetical protein
MPPSAVCSRSWSLAPRLRDGPGTPGHAMEVRMDEAREDMEVKPQVTLTRQEFAHLWAGGVLSLKVAARGVEVSLDLTYEDAAPTRGRRFLFKRLEVD